jgi:hypothetical protein
LIESHRASGFLFIDALTFGMARWRDRSASEFARRNGICLATVPHEAADIVDSMIVILRRQAGNAFMNQHVVLSSRVARQENQDWSDVTRI